jgi:F-type H+-transporting ATPase subunit delta
MAATSEQHDHVLEATGIQARIARVYAEALMATARQAGLADEIGDELDAVVRQVLARHPNIERFFSNLSVGRNAKQQVIDAAFGDANSELLRKFLGVLNQNNRLGLLRAIAAAYQRLRDEAANRVRVRVTSAVELNEAQVAALKNTLTETLNAQPVLDVQTDADLLGGLVVRVGDRVYDTSVRTRLNNIRNHLMASGSYGS